MTSVSSLGSALSQYQAPLNPLDKNGDGVVSADELAAANQSTNASATSSASDGGDDGASIVQKITGDILSLMLQMQQQSDDGSDGSNDDSKGVFASMDTNGDGKLTTSELLSAQPEAAASGDASGESDPFFANIANDMQTALQAYRNTYGAAETADAAAQTAQAL